MYRILISRFDCSRENGDPGFQDVVKELDKVCMLSAGDNLVRGSCEGDNTVWLGCYDKMSIYSRPRVLRVVGIVE